MALFLIIQSLNNSSTRVTVWCCYNAGNLLPNVDNRHPIACPSRQAIAMGCILWVYSLIYILFQSLKLSNITLDCIITVSDCVWCKMNLNIDFQGIEISQKFCWPFLVIWLYGYTDQDEFKYWLSSSLISLRSSQPFLIICSHSQLILFTLKVLQDFDKSRQPFWKLSYDLQK